MNVLAQFVGVVLNVLMTPFNPSAPPMPYIVNSATCHTNLLKLGENEMKVTLAPRGFCPNCCPVKSGVDVHFVLYTKAKPDKGAIIEPHVPGAARRTGVDPKIPTVIYIHGFSEPSPGQSGLEITKAYLRRKDNFNVILLDWSELSTFPWYLPAVRNVKVVAEKLRKFLEVFNDSGEMPIGNVHLIGFSLGSHIAGFAGKQMRKGLRIPRITALDPAFPEYSLRDPSRRLTRTDADYIDVIHTDAGVLGLPIPVGHADFYPNGGRALQPGCQPSYLVQLRLVDQICTPHCNPQKPPLICLFFSRLQSRESLEAVCRVCRKPGSVSGNKMPDLARTQQEMQLHERRRDGLWKSQESWAVLPGDGF